MTLFIYLLKGLKEGIETQREGDTGREKHQSVASFVSPCRNRTGFWCCSGKLPNHLIHLAKLNKIFCIHLLVLFSLKCSQPCWCGSVDLVLPYVRKGHQFNSQSRADAWVAGQVPDRKRTRGNHMLMFLSLSFSLSIF